MPLDETTAALVQQMAALGRPALHTLEPSQARAMSSQLVSLIGPGPEMSRVESHELSTAGDGSFTVRLLVPRQDPAGIVVYLHGGGWVLGHLDQFDTIGRQLARRTGCAVALVDYRRAPEHPFPIGLEDAWQALCWASDKVATDPAFRGPLVLAGDSAGGNFAAVLAHRARDRGGPAIALQVLVYPSTDAAVTTTPSYLDPQNYLLIDRDAMIWFLDHYVGVEQRIDPEVSPLRAASLAGLPPTALVVAEFDVLRDEVEAYGRALAAAGVDLTVKVFHGEAHGFFTLANILPGSEQGLNFVTEQIARAVAAVGDADRADSAGSTGSAARTATTASFGRVG